MSGRWWVNRRVRPTQTPARARHATAVPFGRAGLEEALRLQLRLVTECGVIMLKCAGLPDIAETLGSRGMALALASTSQTLRDAVGDSNLVVSFGEGRFGIVLPGARDVATMAETARRLLLRISEPVVVLDRELVVHAFAGVAPAERDQVEAAVDHAMLACEQARHFGLGHVAIYDSQLARAAGERLRIMSGVGQAALRGELRVVYQAINDLRHGGVVGEEALVRWQHPVLGLVAPNRFIPVAEESDAILSIGLWVLEQACDRMVDRAARRPSCVSMHVNVSVRQLEDLSFPARVREILSSRKLDPQLVTLELTESAVIDDSDRTKEALDALKAVGVRLAIDDFGVGYSSLSYLSRLPIDSVKIDRAFIKGLGTASSDGELVQAINDVGRRLGLIVVAEGIETEGQRAEALRLGCRLGQGFLFGQPYCPIVERVDVGRFAVATQMVGTPEFHV